ncbi:MAG: thiol:disulfide interchange protein DsbA/DsbL [Glaciecola sp.]
MKRLIAALVLGVLLPLQACAQVELWQEGKHYKVISEKASSKPVVKEFFSFWCPACYRFEPLVEQMKAKLPEDTKFTKIHVNFMGFTSRDIQDDATKAMLIARSMKLEGTINGAIFDSIHRKKETIGGMSDIRAIFVANGVDGEKFDKAAKGFGINSLLKRNNKEIDNFRSHLNGVPNFIVNDKYQATFTRDMSVEDYSSLIAWLSKQR